MAFLFAAPVRLHMVYALHRKQLVMPLHSTSMGVQAFSCSSGTDLPVSGINSTFLKEADDRTVWSQQGCHDVVWELELPTRSSQSDADLLSWLLASPVGHSLCHLSKQLVVSPTVVALCQGCQMWRLAGLGMRSYTACTKNLILWGSACQISDQESFRSSVPAHLIHAPCCHIGLSLLNPGPHLLQDKMASVSALDLIITGLMYGSQPQPPCCHCPHQAPVSGPRLNYFKTILRTPLPAYPHHNTY